MSVTIAKDADETASPVHTKRKNPAVHAHPKYIDMVVIAIKNLGGKSRGSSNQAISKYVMENFDVASNVKTYLNNALKKGVEDNLLIRVNGTGANGSFRLASPSKKPSKVATDDESGSDAPPSKKGKSSSKKESSPAKQAKSPTKKTKSSSKKAKSPMKPAVKKAQSPIAKGKKAADMKATKKSSVAKPKSKSLSPSKASKSKTTAAKPSKSKNTLVNKKVAAQKE